MFNHCVSCAIYQLLESYMQEIAYPHIVETLASVEWFGTDLEWEIIEESYYFAMHNSNYFTVLSEILK